MQDLLPEPARSLRHPDLIKAAAANVAGVLVVAGDALSL